jgi:hypothetical protein
MTGLPNASAWRLRPDEGESMVSLRRGRHNQEANAVLVIAVARTERGGIFSRSGLNDRERLARIARLAITPGAGFRA